MKNVILTLSGATLLGIITGWFILQLLVEAAWMLLAICVGIVLVTPQSEAYDIR